ncbi:MAG: tetratricopeptide repeat protein, partial [Anaerolineales bacterium]|nr:tetratricopeptide repeat protein [Anaerolineales bacterium]
DYMAPEQVVGDTVDQRADLYALGVMLFELLTGRLPFHGDSKTAVALRRLAEPAPDPRRIKPDLPEALARVVARSLAREPDERYQTAEEFLGHLQAALYEVDEHVLWPATPGLELLNALPTQPARGAVTRLPAGATVPLPDPPLSVVRTVPPPEPSLPPSAGQFVGRTIELVRYQADLRQRHLAVIFGMPGVGKTTLAAALLEAAGRPARIFWHTFKPGESAAVVIWKLAGFLAWHAQPEVWQMLGASTQTGGTLPPMAVLLDYLFQHLRERGYWLCFDDFEQAAEDAVRDDLLARLLPAVAAGELEAVIISQRRPDFAAEDAEPLAGLSLTDMQALVQARALTLADAATAELYAVTGGNARVLMLALDGLRRAKDPARQIARLTESDQIERFLIKEVDGALTDDERGVMQAVAILLGYPGSRDAISAVMEGESVRRPLNDLVGRSLVQVQDEDGQRVYWLSELVRGYYYDLIHQRDRQAMHQRAAEFYEGIPEPLRSAVHFQRSGEPARAVRLIAADVWLILNQGQGRNLSTTLEQFAQRQLTPADWVTVLWARGQTYAFLGEPDAARASYTAILAAGPAEANLIARTYLGLGELLQYDAPREALDYLERGLTVVQDAQDKASLLIRLGVVQDLLGDSERAIATLQAGLTLLGDAPDSRRATAVTNLGAIYCLRGDLARGVPYFEAALQMYEQLYNLWGMVGAWQNLAVTLDQAGRWEEAQAHYQRALDAAETLGSRGKQFNALLGLGILEHKRGDSGLAEQHLLAAVENARRRVARGDLSYVLPVLAGLYLDTQQLDRVPVLLTEAAGHIQLTGDQAPLPEVERNWGRLELAHGRLDEARVHLEASLSVAQALNLALEAGLTWRVLGQLHLAQGDPAAARAALSSSQQILDRVDAHEAARTQRLLEQL